MWVFLGKALTIAQLAIKGTELIIKGGSYVPKLVPNYKKKDWVSFDVGGTTFKTTRKTLKTDPNSIFPLLLADERRKIEELLHIEKNQQMDPETKIRIESFKKKLTKVSREDDSGKYIFDRDPSYFGPVLNYLRTGKLIYDKHRSLHGILEEARFFEVSGLVKLLEERIGKEEPATPIETPHDMDKLD